MSRPTYHLDHGIASIHFPPRAEDGPCACHCGWDGLASEFAGHVKEMTGAKRHHSRWLKQEGTPEWNRTLNPEAQGKRQAEEAAA